MLARANDFHPCTVIKIVKGKKIVKEAVNMDFLPVHSVHCNLSSVSLMQQG